MNLRTAIVSLLALGPARVVSARHANFADVWAQVRRRASDLLVLGFVLRDA